MNNDIKLVDVKWTKHRVAGAYYHYAANKAGYDRLDALALRKDTTDTLRLERDPTNRYDSKAIRVLDMSNGMLVGWVPKEENTQLAFMMDTLPIEVFAHLIPGKCNFPTQKLYMQLTVLFPKDMSIMVDTTTSAKELSDAGWDDNRIQQLYKDKREAYAYNPPEVAKADAQSFVQKLSKRKAAKVTETGKAALSEISEMLQEHDLNL